MISSIPLLASLSMVQSSAGLLAIGNSNLGLVQLNGRSLVPNPPAKMIAFNCLAPLRGLLGSVFSVKNLFPKRLTNNDGQKYDESKRFF